jgi:DNA-binding transcriptional LysR family regulator
MRRWDAYEALVAVIDSGSFTAAAERLRMSKSAVSRLVSGLEDRLGSQLLFRTTRHLAPTDLGRQVYRKCLEAFADLEQIDQQAMDHDATPRGRLRVIASDTFGEHFIAPLLAEMMATYPDLEIELLITDRNVDIVAEGYDLAIRYSDLVDSTLRTRKLFDLPHVCAASPAYLARMGVPRVPADLARHNCLVSTFEACTPWRFSEGRRERAPQLRGSWVSNNGPALMAAALNGIGVVWLPELYLREQLVRGQLVELLHGFRAPPMPVWSVYPARRHATAKVQLVIDHLRERLAGLMQSA